jgi:hypothetical protein
MKAGGLETSPWIGIGWCALGLFSLLVGLVWFLFAAREFRLWLCADYYVPAELEVTRFTPKPRDSSARAWIEGVIHPGGEEVTARGGDISINQFDGPHDRWGHEPRPGELEGQRLPVAYWPSHGEVERWWHPPSIVARETIPAGGAVVRDVIVSGAFFIVALFFFRRGVRSLKAVFPRDPGE